MIILTISSKNFVDNPQIRIGENKMKNRITFKIRVRYYLRKQLELDETMKLLASTENKITEDNSDENVLHLEITEILLVHCNIVNYDYQHDS